MLGPGHLASKADITFCGPFRGAFTRGLYHSNLRTEEAQWPLIQKTFLTQGIIKPEISTNIILQSI